MRYFVIPEPSEIAGKPYDTLLHFRSHVAGHPAWRASADKLRLLGSLLEKMEASAGVPGVAVECTDAEHEAGTPVVTMAGVQLSLEAAPAINRIAAAWLSAGTKPPS